MNYLCGNMGRDVIIESEQAKKRGEYSSNGIRVEMNRDNGKQSFIEKGGIVIGLIGEIYSEMHQDELEYIYQIYLESGITGLNQLNGFYTIFIVDNTKNAAFVVQDKNTSLEHIYYCERENVMYISNNLEVMLNKSGIARQVNTAALPTFLHYSFTPGNETLLSGVFKIPTNHFLKYDLKTFEYKLIKIIDDNPKSANVQNESLIKVIDKAITKRIDTKKKMGFSLSGGFDSNLLFSRAVNLLEEEEINTFSYGYNSPTSEIKNVERIVELYRKKGFKINHYKYFAKAEDVFKLPQIISFLQEPILEPGLIFHYGMAKLIEDNNIEVLLGGDCNDQVYDKRLYFDMISKMQEPINSENYPVYGRLRLGEFDRIHTYKYFTDIETEWLLNPNLPYNTLNLRLEVYSDVFTNYFMTKRFFVREHDISVRLPFLDANYVNYINNSLEIEDLPFKKRHIQLCEEYIPSDIYSELINATEATSPYSYLFLDDDDSRKSIFALVLSSDTTKKYFNMRSIEKLLDSFELALVNGKSTNNYYKASVLSCRIFAVLGFLVWHNIYINGKSPDSDIFAVLSEYEKW